MDIIKKIKNVLQEPKEFFQKLTKEKDMLKHLKFYLIILIFYTFFMGIYNLVNILTEGTTITIGSATLVFFISLIGIYIGLVGGVFFSALICFIFLMLFKGKGDYIQTFNASVYSAVPILVFMPFIYIIMSLIVLIPQDAIKVVFGIVIGLVSLGISIYSIYLNLIGQSKAHKIEKWKVFIACYVIPAVLFILFFIAVIFIFGGLASLMGTTGAVA